MGGAVTRTLQIRGIPPFTLENYKSMEKIDVKKMINGGKGSL